MRISFAFGIALAMTAPATLWAGEPTGAQEQAAVDPEVVPDVITLSADKNRRMTVDVTINGNGPYPFIVDTGAEGTLIPRELAEQLSLRGGPEVKIHSMGASKVVRTAVIPQLAANKMIVKDVVAPALTRSNLGAAGILGLPALKSQRMLLDFKAGSMTLTPSDEAQENWEGESIVVTARSRLGQLILTDASIDGDHVQVIVDTGNYLSVGNLALRRLLTARRAAPFGGRAPIELLDVTGNTTQVNYTIVDQLRIATLGFENVPIAFADAHVFTMLGLKRTPTLLLGMDVLRFFGRVSIDFGKRRVRFQRSEAYIVPASGNVAQSPRGQPPAAK